jgi:hypothetical protein
VARWRRGAHQCHEAVHEAISVWKRGNRLKIKGLLATHVHRKAGSLCFLLTLSWHGALKNQLPFTPGGAGDHSACRFNAELLSGVVALNKEPTHHCVHAGGNRHQPHEAMHDCSASQIHLRRRPNRSMSVGLRGRTELIVNQLSTHPVVALGQCAGTLMVDQNQISSVSGDVTDPLLYRTPDLAYVMRPLTKHVLPCAPLLSSKRPLPPHSIDRLPARFVCHQHIDT